MADLSPERSGKSVQTSMSVFMRRLKVLMSKMADQVEFSPFTTVDKYLHLQYTCIFSSSSLLLFAAAVKRAKRRDRKKRSRLVDNWLLSREESGAYHQLMNELKLSDSDAYQRYIRMNEETFEVSMITFSII